MATNQMSEVIQHLRRTALLHDGAGPTDGQLLEDYISRSDQAAFAGLVRRHGPMVWGVCRRVLRNHHDAEDAFQATFLVLVRKATSVLPRQMVANWLYGVAQQTALNARATAAKRKGRERQVTQVPEPAVSEQDLWRDLQPLLDEELSRLPDKYRVVIVLCDLEAKTRKEAARQIGVPEGTVAGWLARARVMLARRLTGRGVTLSGGVLAAALSQKAASAAVPTSVVSATINAAGLFAAGEAAGTISVKVAALTEGVTKAMLLTKLKSVMVGLLVIAVAVVGFGGSLCWTLVAAGPGEQEAQPSASQNGAEKKPTLEEALKLAVEAAEHDVADADARLKNAKERLSRVRQVYEAATQGNQKKENEEGCTAWGKEVDGLQAGLGFRPGEQGISRAWGMVTLVVRVRNVGKKQMTFQYSPEFVWQELPEVTDATGKPIALEGGLLALAGTSKEVNVAPGKPIELFQLELYLRPESERIKPTFPTTPYPTLYGTGKFIIQYKRVAGDWWMLKPPTLSKLATGKLELEVASDPPPATETNAAKEKLDAILKRQVKGKVEELYLALLKGDVAKLVDHAHPEWVKKEGGREKMIATLKGVADDLKAKGFAFQALKVVEPKEILADGVKRFALVPYVAELKGMGGKVTQEAVVIGISGDQGKTWTFVSGDAAKIKLLLPKLLPETLKLPESRQPVFEKGG